MNCEVLSNEETDEMYVQKYSKDNMADHSETNAEIKHFDEGLLVKEDNIKSGVSVDKCVNENEMKHEENKELFRTESSQCHVASGSVMKDESKSENNQDKIDDSDGMGFVTDQDIMKYYDGIYLTLTKQIVENEFKVAKPKPYICDICGKTFTETYTLNLHMKLHTGENLHKCEICGKFFTLASNLRSHLRLHSGDKPYKCKICGNEYNQAGDLARHERSHTGERPYVCQICGKSFMRAEHCKTHQTVHTGIKAHKCDVCGRTFSHIGHLRTHVRIHSGDKPFHCDICGKEFTHSSDKNKHAVVHSTEKPFKCQFCDKAFARKDCKNRHEKTHTKNQLQN